MNYNTIKNTALSGLAAATLAACANNGHVERSTQATSLYGSNATRFVQDHDGVFYRGTSNNPLVVIGDVGKKCDFDSTGWSKANGSEEYGIVAKVLEGRKQVSAIFDDDEVHQGSILTSKDVNKIEYTTNFTQENGKKCKYNVDVLDTDVPNLRIYDQPGHGKRNDKATPGGNGGVKPGFMPQGPSVGSGSK